MRLGSGKSASKIVSSEMFVLVQEKAREIMSTFSWYLASMISTSWPFVMIRAFAEISEYKIWRALVSRKHSKDGNSQIYLALGGEDLRHIFDLTLRILLV